MSTGMLVATFLTPLAMLAACLAPGVRARIAGWLWLAPLPGLAAALLAAGAPPLVVDEARLRLTLALDPAGAALLGASSVLWIAAGLYARRHLAGDEKASRFAEWWLPTLAGSLGVYFAADLLTFYIAFALVSLAAWGLVVHDGTARAERAASIYLGLAVLGEICLLLAFAVLAVEEPGDTLAIRDVVAALPASPARHLAIALLVAGFGLKAGLVPLHVWLPLAHPAAPMPASAVLSGAIVKAGVIGLVRFLPFDAALAEWGAALAGLGLLTAYYAVAVGITQANPKTVLAYSTASQMGGVAAILGTGIATGQPAAVPAALFAAAHHVLVKGALFLAVGVAGATGAARRWTVQAPAAILSLALAGLPLTGGAFVKLAAKPVFGSGLVATLAALSAAGTTLLMLHFLARLPAAPAARAASRAPLGLAGPWLATAVAALALPFALAPRAVGLGAGDVLAPAALLEALGPIALGAGLALALRRFAGSLPAVPEGDLVVLGAGAATAARRVADTVACAERHLRPWPAAGVSLLLLAIASLAAILAAR